MTHQSHACEIEMVYHRRQIVVTMVHVVAN